MTAPELFGHPFSSYTWKALIAFYEKDLPVTLRVPGPDDPETSARFATLAPLGKFPLLVDGDQVVPESSIIIEHLDLLKPEPAMIPADRRAALAVRLLDRLFDNFVMTPMQTIVGDALRPAERRDPTGVDQAKAALDRAYDWLDAHIGERQWAAGDDFSLADCAAAPGLFYADWVQPIAGHHTALKGYRARLLARPSVARCVEAARPYRSLFPPGAPNRD